MIHSRLQANMHRHITRHQGMRARTHTHTHTHTHAHTYIHVNVRRTHRTERKGRR